MQFILRIILESYRQAIGQLTGNRLRSFLSLLGISIGIFCIIAVKSAVDSLESNIRDSFNELGDDAIYITKQPWTEDPSMNYWKYLRRPNPNITDYRALRTRMTTHQYVSMVYFLGGKTLKHASSSVDNVFMLATTEDYSRMFNIKLQSGRYFSPFEYQNGTNKVIIGSEIAKELFDKKDPIGRDVKLFGRTYQIIGVFEPKGESLINIANYDEAAMITIPNARKMFNLGINSPYMSNLSIKAAPGATLDDIRDEAEQILRSHRRLKPKEDSNFAVNELTMLTNLLDGFFRVLNIAGFLIGIFALFVGMFSVANIMFVSVKERTSLIGIKKALGARSRVILLEFLIESVILCIIGGIMGLFFVFISLYAISALINFQLALSFTNVLIGVITSAVIGILSGVLPAIQAAKLDPVEAMRQ
jgi:putative ABC transport system permease protein